MVFRGVMILVTPGLCQCQEPSMTSQRANPGCFKVRCLISSVCSFVKSGAKNSKLTQRFQHIHLLGVIPDGVRVDEPAVVLVSHLAVTQREVLVIRLRQLVLILHLHHVIVATVLTAFLFKRQALNTVSVKRFQIFVSHLSSTTIRTSL